jgi:hypothetical protein
LGPSFWVVHNLFSIRYILNVFKLELSSV